jgi:hypothetical protein
MELEADNSRSAKLSYTVLGFLASVDIQYISLQFRLHLLTLNHLVTINSNLFEVYPDDNKCKVIFYDIGGQHT